MKEIEKQVKEFYNSKSLSIEQFEAIGNGLNNKNKQQIVVSNILKYAAVFIVFVGILYSLFLLPKQRQNSIVNEFADEIAFNHRKKLPAEIKTNNVLVLNKKMDKLDFEIVLPQKISTNLVLKGGRYCSVDNRIAAQLKLENKQGKRVTCYVFKKNENFEFDKKVIKDNVEVTFWDDKVLIFALATEKD